MRPFSLNIAREESGFICMILVNGRSVSRSPLRMFRVPVQTLLTSVYLTNKNDVGLFGRFLGEIDGVGETDGIFQIVAVRRDLVAPELVWKSPVKWTGIVIFVLAGRLGIEIVDVNFSGPTIIFDIFCDDLQLGIF